MAYESPSESTLNQEQLKLDIYQKAQPIIGRLKKAGVDVGEFESQFSSILPDRSASLTDTITAVPKVLGSAYNAYQKNGSFGDALKGGAEALSQQLEPLAITSRKVITDYIDTARDALNIPKIETPERKLNEIQYKQSMATNPISTVVRDIATDPLTYAMPSSKLLQAESVAGRFAKGASVNAPLGYGSYALRNGGQDNYDSDHSAIAGVASGLLGGLLNIPFGKIPKSVNTADNMLSDEEKARRMVGGTTLPEKEPPIEADVVNPFNQQVMDDWAKFQNGELSLEELRAKYQNLKPQPTPIENKGTIPQPQLTNNHAINMGAEGWSQPLGHRIQGELDAKAGRDISAKDDFFSEVTRLANEDKMDEFNALMNGLSDETRLADEALNLPPKKIGVSELDSLARQHLGAPLADIIGTNKQTLREIPTATTQAQQRAKDEAQKLFDSEIKNRADNVIFDSRAGFNTSPVATTIASSGVGSLAPIDYDQDGEVSTKERALSALLAGLGINIPSIAKNIGKPMQKATEAPSGMRNGMITQAQIQESTWIPQELEKFGRNFAQFSGKPKERNARLTEWHKDSHPLTKNEDGTPKVFYHGTGADFDVFDNTKSSKARYGVFHHLGHFFTTDKNMANEFASTHNVKNGSVMPTYLNLRNPMVVRALDMMGKTQNDFIKQGYDGLIKGDVAVAFYPSQIKSIHNKGTFDETNPNILHSINPSLGVPTVGAGLMATSEQLKADDGSMSPIGSALAMAGAGALAYKFGGKALNVANKVGSKAITATAKALDDVTANKISKTWDSFTSNRLVDSFLGTKIYKLEDYMKLRGDYTKSLNPKLEMLEKMHIQLAEFNQSTREAMYDYMTGKSVQLPSNIKKLADNFRNEIDSVTDELVKYGALTQEQANAYKGKYLHRQYTSKMSDMFSFGGDKKTLSDVKHRGRSWEGSEAEYQRYMQSGELGDFTDGKIVAQKQSNGKYKFFQDWSDAQRTKWGEVKDVAFSIPETLGAMYERLENAKFLRAISNDARYVAPQGMSHEDAIANGYIKLEGKRYGQLSGKYLTPEIASDIKAFADSIHGSDGQFATIADAWKKTISYIKSTHTIYSPTAHVNNLMSNLTFQFAEGINSPIKMVSNFIKGATGHRKANEMLRLEAVGQVRQLTTDEANTLRALMQDDDVLLYREAKLKGLFGKSQLNDTLNQYIKPRTQYKNKTLSTIHEKAGSVYGAEDDMMRFSLLKTLKEMNPNQSVDELIDRVNNTIPDYSKPMSAVARKLRDTGFVPFIGFTYHAMPILLRQMKERPASVATLAGIMGVIYAANDINPFDGNDIPDEGYSFKRLPIMQNGNIVTTIKVDKWIPHYDLLSSMTDFSQGAVPEFVRGQLVGGIPQNIVGGLINYNPYFNQRVTQKEGAQKAYQLTKHNVQQFTPDFIDNAYNLAESKLADKKTRRYNKVIEPRETWQEVAKNLGVNIQSYNKSEQSRKNMAEKLK